MSTCIDVREYPMPVTTAQRRRRLRESVLGARSFPETDPLRPVEGVIVDASPHLLVLTARDGTELRLPMAADASVWHGGKAGLEALLPGRTAVVRPSGPAVARIWVDIARVTGVIVDRGPEVIEVDAGPHRGRVCVTIPKHALGRVQVRHPQLEPGALLDVIGIRRDGQVRGLLPATSPQPTTLADVRASGTSVLRGTATWHERCDRAAGASYPALDPHGDGGGCADAARSCTTLPVLSLGSELHVRNDCTGRAAIVPIIECGCLAARFCDRCVQCGTSPRGRILELDRTTFVALGGDLDQGCFNVTVRAGER